MSRKTPKTTVISIRVPIEQREAIETAAVTAGASVSGFVAATMGEAMSRKKAAPAASAAPSTPLPTTHAVGISISDPTALAELKRIGININQLAHAANAGYPPNVASMLDSLKGLLALLSEPDTFKRHIERLSAGPAAKLPSTEPSVQVEPVPPKPTAAPSPSTAPPRRPSLPPGLATLIGEAGAARPKPKLPTRAVTPNPEAPAPRLPPRPQPQANVKDDRRAPQHPQARNQLQSRPELRPARPAEGDDGKGRLGLFRKLWER